MTPRSLRLLAVAAALLLTSRAGLAAGGTGVQPFEEKSLLSSDGTLFDVRAGTATDLGIVGGSLGPGDKVIEWSSRQQDGTVTQGILPDTDNGDVKHNLQIAYDEPTGSLVLLWNEELTVLNVLRLAVLRNGTWTVGNLLPNPGFAHAYNPQMLLSHQMVSLIDANGVPVTQTRTLLSVIWWEESQYAQARYAPLFLDDDSGPNDVVVYDLPSFVGGGGPTPAGNHPPTSYMFPSLQVDGISGGLLATFADLSSSREYVVRITFPDNLGRPGPDNVTWQRRRIPVVGIASDAPITDDVPVQITGDLKTVIGTSYRPTLVWSTGTAVSYLRFDGRSWSSTRTIPLSDSMTYDRALRLVQEMATRN